MRIIIDTDPGVDDALALLYLAAKADVDIVAVGSVHGNVPAPQGAANALRILELVARPHVPVAVGAHRPLAQALRTAEFVHGDDGLGGHSGPPALTPPVEVSAAEQLVRLARAHPGELTLLALGPLTNVALAVMLEPELPRLLRRVLFVGGAVGVPGNATPYADANVWHDPEAADLVLAAGFQDLTLVGLNVTEAVRADEHWLAALAALPGPRARFASAILEHYVGFYHAMLGSRVCTLHDPLAAAIAVDPELATYRHLALEVELRGVHTRGQVLTDLRKLSSDVHIESTMARGRYPAKVAETVDRDRFLNEMLIALKELPRGLG